VNRWELPARKIYRATWADRNRAKCLEYGRRYLATHPQPSRAAPPRQCATLLCPNMVLPAHGRRFCDECREVLGYAAHTRWYHRKREREA
jgi:hypothetical protein